jgi:hypothetical protein
MDLSRRFRGIAGLYKHGRNMARHAKDFGRLILITDYSGPPGLPRLVSGDVGAKQ